MYRQIASTTSSVCASANSSLPQRTALTITLRDASASSKTFSLSCPRRDRRTLPAYLPPITYQSQTPRSERSSLYGAIAVEMTLPKSASVSDRKLSLELVRIASIMLYCIVSPFLDMLLIFWVDIESRSCTGPPRRLRRVERPAPVPCAGKPTQSMSCCLQDCAQAPATAQPVDDRARQPRLFP